MRYITHKDLWSISWVNLVRFARHLSLKVKEGPEKNRRGPLVDAIMARIVDLQLEDAAKKGKKYG